MQTEKSEITKMPKEELYKEFFRVYYASLCVFARQYVENAEIAEDIVQDFFCKLWERKKELPYIENEKNYLYTSIRNLCLNYLRKDTVCIERFPLKDIEMKEQEDFFVDEYLQEQVYLLLDEAIELLPEKSRQVLLMKLEGLKNDEIADRLHVSVNTVNTLKTNSYKIIRKRLQQKIKLCLLFYFKLKTSLSSGISKK